MMPKRWILAVAIAGIGIAASGCVSMLTLNVLQPAPVNFGAAKRLSVVQSEGRRSAREVLIADLMKQVRSGGYFTGADRSEEGITVKVAGRNVLLTGGAQPQAKDEIYVRIDVLEWTSESGTTTISESYTEGTGKEKKTLTRKREVPAHVGKVLLGITASNQKGKALLAEKEYTGASSVEKSKGDAASATETAGRSALALFLAEITPRTVKKQVRLDDEDAGQKPILAVAKKGNLAQAVTEMTAYRAQNPKNPSAAYNLAVLLDATGDYEAAMPAYTEACSQSTKDFYVTAKAECAKRLADQQALNQ